MRLVWLVDPQRSEVRVYRPDGSLTVPTAEDSLDGEAVPGFACTVAGIFSRV